MEKSKKPRLTTMLFHSQESAEKAYQDALKRGYKPNEINVIMSDATRKKYYGSVLVDQTPGDKSMKGLAIGGASGGIIGGTIGAILAIGTNLALPGLGLIVSGPLVAGLVGAGAGSISGGLIGTLIGWGIPEEHAVIYERGVKKGGIILVVHEKSEKELADVWKKHKTA